MWSERNRVHPDYSQGTTLKEGGCFGSNPILWHHLRIKSQLIEPYPQPFPLFSHGGKASQSYKLKAFPRLKGEDFRSQTFDPRGRKMLKYHHSNSKILCKGLHEDNLEKVLQRQTWLVSSCNLFSKLILTCHVPFKFMCSTFTCLLSFQY
jgi:hypothetical protein